MINSAYHVSIPAPGFSAAMQSLHTASERISEALAPLKGVSLDIPQIPVRHFTPPPARFPVSEETPFAPNRQTIQYMLDQTGLSDSDLLESMLPKVVTATKVAPHRYEIKICPMIDRIKWRIRMAARFGMSMEVFQDERIDENTKTDDLAILQSMASIRSAADSLQIATKEDVAAMCAGQSSIMEKIDGIDHRVAEGIEATRQVGAAVTALVPPRPADLQCSERELEEILGNFGVKRGERQIRRWEEFLLNGGKSGSKPPMGYTLQTRLTIAAATAWARSFANHEKGKLSAKTFFDERFSRRRT